MKTDDKQQGFQISKAAGNNDINIDSDKKLEKFLSSFLSHSHTIWFHRNLHETVSCALVLRMKFRDNSLFLYKKLWPLNFPRCPLMPNSPRRFARSFPNNKKILDTPLDQIKNEVGNGINQVVSEVTGTVDEIGQGVENIIDDVKTEVEKIVGQILNIVNGIQFATQLLWDVFFSPTFDAIMLGTISHSITSKFSSIVFHR